VPGWSGVGQGHWRRRAARRETQLAESGDLVPVPLAFLEVEGVGPHLQPSAAQPIGQSMLTCIHRFTAIETDELRDQYGRNLFGSSMLIARRLVERGVPFISVHAENFLPDGSFTYDMHENNFNMLKHYNLPVLDLCVPALVNDLDSRGLLDSTLIFVMGEMGRSPKVNGLA